MAESRRVHLTTLSCGVASFSSNPPRSALQGPTGVLEDKAAGSERLSVVETVRLVVALFEPDKKSFPEFNYCELVERKLKQTEDEVPLTRLELEGKREQDEVADIARKLEEKYGDKRKKKDRIQDLVDIGFGYDDDDSFIDNSEAKRKLDEEHDKPKKRCKAIGEMKSNSKLSTVSKTGVDDLKVIHRNKQKKKAAKMLSVTSMLKKFQREKETERQKANQMLSAVRDATPASLFQADAAGGGGSGLTDPLLSLIGSTNDHALIQAASTVDFDIDLDSLLEVSEENMSPKSLPQTAAETQLIKARPDLQIQHNIQSEAEPQLLTGKTNQLPKPHTEQLQLQAEAGPVAPSQSAPLPEGLPLELEESVRTLVMAAKTLEGESKLKFFSPDINSILLDIELQCQEQSSQLRSKLYKHLSSFVPCSKDTLMKRVKKLLVTHEVSELLGAEDPLQKLNEAIERSMPEQMARFQESCQAYEQAKSSKVTEEENTEEKSSRKGVPKKLFQWNQEIRDCLDLFLKEQLEKCQNEGKERQELEEYLKTVLDNEVKPLWPKGWMPLRVNKAKGFQAEKRQSSVGGASKATEGCRSLQGTEELKFESGVSVSSPSKADKPPAIATSAPGRSLLDILAEQALALEQPHALSRDYLATAVFKPWSFGMEDRSPPPPPHSSPINFPESQVVLPQLLQVGDGKSFGASQLRNGQ
ncbi:ubinuclein-1-like [Fundulus diaphanus]